VNIRDPAQILALGAGSLTAGKAIDVPAAGPHGLWLDGERLFCAADGRALVVLHRDTGAVLGTVPLPGEPDVVMHDSALRRLYIAIGEPGVICVVDSDRLHLLQTVPTGPGAHTLGIDRTSTPSTRSSRAAAARRSTWISDPGASAVRGAPVPTPAGPWSPACAGRVRRIDDVAGCNLGFIRGGASC
jgi:hypothetical protein